MEMTYPEHLLPDTNLFEGVVDLQSGYFVKPGFSSLVNNSSSVSLNDIFPFRSVLKDSLWGNSTISSPSTVLSFSKTTSIPSGFTFTVESDIDAYTKILKGEAFEQVNNLADFVWPETI